MNQGLDFNSAVDRTTRIISSGIYDIITRGWSASASASVSYIIPGTPPVPVTTPGMVDVLTPMFNEASYLLSLMSIPFIPSSTDPMAAGYERWERFFVDVLKWLGTLLVPFGNFPGLVVHPRTSADTRLSTVPWASPDIAPPSIISDNTTKIIPTAWSGTAATVAFNQSMLTPIMTRFISELSLNSELMMQGADMSSIQKRTWGLFEKYLVELLNSNRTTYTPVITNITVPPNIANVTSNLQITWSIPLW